MNSSGKSDWNAKHHQDLQLWQDWQQSGKDPQQLEPLMDQLKPLIESRKAKFGTLTSVPQSAVDAELKRQTLYALETYDPNKNVPLSIHVYNNLKGANRFIYNYQNTARIPAHRVRKIGDFQAAFKELESKTGRPPTSHELADHLGWPVSEVTRMTQQLRQDLLPVEGSVAETAMIQTPSIQKEVMDLMPYELDPFDLAVYEYTYGYGGKPVLETKQIAKTLKVPPIKVYRSKTNIAKKFDEYLQASDINASTY